MLSRVEHVKRFITLGTVRIQCETVASKLCLHRLSQKRGSKKSLQRFNKPHFLLLAGDRLCPDKLMLECYKILRLYRVFESFSGMSSAKRHY